MPSPIQLKDQLGSTQGLYPLLIEGRPWVMHRAPFGRRSRDYAGKQGNRVGRTGLWRKESEPFQQTLRARSREILAAPDQGLRPHPTSARFPLTRLGRATKWPSSRLQRLTSD